MDTKTKDLIEGAAAAAGDTVLETGPGWNIIAMSDNAVWLTFDTDIAQVTTAYAYVMDRADALGFRHVTDVMVGPRFTHYVAVKKRWS